MRVSVHSHQFLRAQLCTGFWTIMLNQACMYEPHYLLPPPQEGLPQGSQPFGRGILTPETGFKEQESGSASELQKKWEYDLQCIDQIFTPLRSKVLLVLMQGYFCCPLTQHSSNIVMRIVQIIFARYGLVVTDLLLNMPSTSFEEWLSTYWTLQGCTRSLCHSSFFRWCWQLNWTQIHSGMAFCMLVMLICWTSWTVILQFHEIRVRQNKSTDFAITSPQYRLRNTEVRLSLRGSEAT